MEEPLVFGTSTKDNRTYKKGNPESKLRSPGSSLSDLRLELDRGSTLVRVGNLKENRYFLLMLVLKLTKRNNNHRT